MKKIYQSYRKPKAVRIEQPLKHLKNNMIKDVKIILKKKTYFNEKNISKLQKTESSKNRATY